MISLYFISFHLENLNKIGNKTLVLELVKRENRGYLLVLF